jgi:pilus assembly protein Flp/PilA
MKEFLLDFKSDESGATAIEYALIASGISIAIISGLVILTGGAANLYNLLAESI